MKIIAVVVTYNRCDLLKECLTALLGQSVPLDKILVIDNASTDGTKQLLTEEFDKDVIEVVFNDENTGGAGGFQKGIKLACEKGYDWVWCMDDDTIPSLDALKELITHPRFKDEKTNILCSRVLWGDTNLHHLRSLPLLHNGGYPEFLDEGANRISACTFISCLIRTKAIYEFGLPYKEFFIWFDDSEFTGRILKKSRGYLIGKSIVNHLTDSNESNDVININKNNAFKYFYYFRNKTFHELNQSFSKISIFKNHFIDFLNLLIHSSNKYIAIKCFIIGLIKGYKFSPKVEFPK